MLLIKQEYFNMRAVVQAEHLEGWNPTKKDIEYVYKEITNPKPEYLKEYHTPAGYHNGLLNLKSCRN